MDPTTCRGRQQRPRPHGRAASWQRQVVGQPGCRVKAIRFFCPRKDRHCIRGAKVARNGDLLKMDLDSSYGQVIMEYVLLFALMGILTIAAGQILTGVREQLPKVFCRAAEAINGARPIVASGPFRVTCPNGFFAPCQSDVAYGCDDQVHWSCTIMPGGGGEGDYQLYCAPSEGAGAGQFVHCSGDLIVGYTCPG